MVTKKLRSTSCIVESSEIAGPYGMHTCLVFEPMRETLSLFQSRLKQKRFPLELLKMYLVCLLNGLDYLHSECHVIHAGELANPRGRSTTRINSSFF
jgi:serine/threonine protein kinase